jgi:hypothetical protein
MHRRQRIPGKPAGRIKQRRHPAMRTGLPDGAALIGPTISCRPFTTGEPRKPHRPDQATPPSGYLRRTARWRYAYRAYKYHAGRSRPGEPRETPQAGSGNAAIRLSAQDCPMALRLSGLQTSCRPFTTGRAPGNPTGRIKQRRHPAISAGLPDGATLIGPTISCRPLTTGEPRKTPQAG